MQNEVFFGDKSIICGLFLLNLQDFDVTIKVETINKLLSLERGASWNDHTRMQILAI